MPSLGRILSLAGPVEESDSIMNLARLISQAAAAGDRDAVSELLDGDPTLSSSYAQDGCTRLHVAAYNGHIEVAELLLARGAEVDARTHNGLAETPLLKAVIGQHVDAVILLLAHGADVNRANDASATPLHKSAVQADPALTHPLVPPC